MGICFCGSLAGYPHRADCPYPLFRASDAPANPWYRTWLDGYDQPLRDEIQRTDPHLHSQIVRVEQFLAESI